ncbi:MAG: LysR family transcriptional regulator [Chthoniobacterales bacterium]
MEWLNYHHLRYFWTVASLGSLRKASEKLHVSQPSISAQLRSLQEALGEKLFQRRGRNLVLTEMGQLVHGYAEAIFSLGEEMLSSVQGVPGGRPMRLNVGITDAVPKLVAREILRPALYHKPPVQVVCHEASLGDLLARLTSLRLDIVLADEPAASRAKLRTYNHLLGSCGVTFCAAPALARKLRRGFPQSLHGAPALLPTHNTSLRGSLEKWFQKRGLRPLVLGEFEDTALMSVIASEGLGFIPMAEVVAKELRQFHLEPIGTTASVTAQFYAITAERRLRHPAVALLTENAKNRLFSSKRKRRQE